jgi:hypothetical protein
LKNVDTRSELIPQIIWYVVHTFSNCVYTERYVFQFLYFSS